MPAILDRCVAHLQARGVSTSSSYAICTSSLQRAGKLPRGKSKKELEVEFGEWSKRVLLPSDFTLSMQMIWEHFAPGDVNLLKALRKVSVLDEDYSDQTDPVKRKRELARRKRILGEARLHSKNISMNPKALVRIGDHPVWYGTVAIHEAQHAVYGFGEHEATRGEQRWLGKLFAEYSLDFDKPAMMLTMRAAAVAQAQREKDVHHAHRAKDFHFLNSVGFTARAARRILAIGRAMEKYRKWHVQQEDDAAKDYYDFMEGDLTWIERTVDADLEEAFGDLIEKTFFPVVHGVERLLGSGAGGYADAVDSKGARGGRNPYMGSPAERRISTGGDVPVSSGVSSPSPPSTVRNPYDDRYDYMVTADTPTPWTTVAGMMERYINRSITRRVGKELRGPLGVVPALRRAGWDAKNLPAEWKEKRLASLRECLPSLKTQGLFDEDGEVTDAHLLCLLHAWTPVPHLIFDDEALDVVLV
jgi:hypothetical protein